MVYFYPERMDLFRQAAELARQLGGELHPPSLSWKYKWIRAMFGLPTAKRAQVTLPRLRWSAVRAWDKMLSQIAPDESQA